MTTAADRTSTRHAGLDRDEVIDRALALVDEGGAGALSMRKLAAELGVTTTTIYWHVGSRDELVIALIQRQAERQAGATIVGRTSTARVYSAACNIWENALGHRNVTALATQVGATTLLELPLETALVAELERAGIHGEEARDALRSILACIAGFLVMAWRSDDRVPEPLRAASLWAQVDDPRVSAPTLVALGTAADVDELFERSVRAVVASFVGNRPRGTT